MKIAFVGDYLPDYNRTQIIRKGLLALGHHVIDFPFNKKNKAAKNRIKELNTQADVFFMPAFTHQQVGFVKRHAAKKIVFDPLISRFMTKVHDYKLVSPYGLSALRNHFRDKWSLHGADFVVTDTKSHLEYFHQRYGLAKEKLGVLYIGNDFEEFHPGVKPIHNKFRVGFYGGFIPLQGVMNIIEAAGLLSHEADIEFQLIGSGFEFEKAKNLILTKELQNVKTPGWLDSKSLLLEIQNFDVALGIFGETQKADLVIPNKVYHYAACAKPIITKESPAIRELFSHEKDIYLTGTSPAAIADAILKLKSNSTLSEKLGQNAYSLLKENYTAEHVAKKLVSYFEKVI